MNVDFKLLGLSCSVYLDLLICCSQFPEARSTKLDIDLDLLQYEEGVLILM